MRSEPVVLITDSEQRAALAAARSLSRAGFRVETVGRNRGIAGVSQSVSAHHSLRTDDGALESERVRAVVLRLARAGAIDVVLPTTDAASQALLPDRASLGVAIAGPSAGAYARASDKSIVLRVAQRLGIAIPQQRLVTSRETAVQAATELNFPIVVKPTVSTAAVAGSVSATGARYVTDLKELARIASEMDSARFPLLLQERVFGEGVGVFLYRTDGETHLCCGHRRLREKPPAGGVSTYREATVVDPTTRATCEKLLDDLDYSGAAMIEFKRRESDGVLVLMEINARLWGSLQLAIDAGVDFPVWLVRDALGLARPLPTEFRSGTRTFWELGELDHVLAIALKSRESLRVPPNFPVGLAAAARTILSRRWHDRPEVFRWSDPAPFGAECAAWFRGMLR